MTSAMPPIAVIPLMSFAAAGAAMMRLPACEGLKVLRMTTGMSLSMTGPSVCGWMTLAPKYASSMASL